jgi:C_GCAxxG_C_C family probable redox protein
MSKREETAAANFLAGCNCAQAVLMAYADVLGLTQEQAALVSVGHGGGMGRLRLHCGAFSAAVMLAGAIEGPDGPKKEHRPQTYARVQAIHRRFVEQNGTISCAELLGRAKVPENPTPEERTPEYYARRPCERVIRSACRIIDEMLEETAHA